MLIVAVRFRVPEGDELSEERIELLDELGHEEANLSSEDDGEITLRIFFDEDMSETEIADEIEELAEKLSDASGDMDLLDFEFAED